MTLPEDLRLRYYPDPVLRMRAAPVRRVDDDVRARARAMFRIMYEHGGIGLSGPQVGWLERIFVVNLTGEEEQADQEEVYINPRITSPEGSATEEEGCLSFPQIRIEITRPERVHVRALDLEGKPFERRADGLLARCAQHEFDHLDGIVFTTRTSITRRLQLRKALKELECRFEEEERAG
ncbi:MAG: peptide deformylase [Planctomycetota bacterium]